MTIQDIKDVEVELDRFQKRLKEAKVRYLESGDCMFYGCKESASLKRSALDLKSELTKITK